MTKNEAYDYLTNTDNDITKDELIQYLSDWFSSEILTTLVEHIKEEKGTNDSITDIEDE